MTGTLPFNFGGASKLQYVDVSGNYIGGSVPSSFSSLMALQYLDVSDNLISSQFPSAALSGMLSLVTLDASANLLTGTVPQFMPRWINVTNGTATVSLLTSADFSFNNLTGERGRTLAAPHTRADARMMHAVWARVPLSRILRG